MKNQPKILTPLLMAVFAIAISSPLLFAETPQHKRPCKQDVETFCKDVKRGKGAIHKCLDEHQGQLSLECKEKRAERQAKFDAACGDDAAKLCAGIKHGEGLGKCLREHRDELSTQCRELKHKHHGKRKLTRACRDDVTKHCANIEPGEGRIHQCLMLHKADLSPKCSKRVAKLK